MILQCEEQMSLIVFICMVTTHLVDKKVPNIEELLFSLLNFPSSAFCSFLFFSIQFYSFLFFFFSFPYFFTHFLTSLYSSTLNNSLQHFNNVGGPRHLKSFYLNLIIEVIQY